MNCRAVVIGGSAGSLDVILHILPLLNRALAFPVVIVLHRKDAADSLLAELFSHKTKIPVKEIEDKDAVEKGVIFIAPAGYHLLIEEDGFFSLDASEKINYSRPSIDTTFESAAEVYGSDLVCLLLSGANADGKEGLQRVKQRGGVVAIQDPATAKVPYMPEQGRAFAAHVLKVEEIAAFINAL